MTYRFYLQSVNIADSDDEDDEDDDFEDETLVERLIGLTEMFPPGLITGIKDLSTGSVGAVKWTYSKSRNLTWIVFSSAAILFLPVNIDNYTDVRRFFGYKI